MRAEANIGVANLLFTGPFAWWLSGIASVLVGVILELCRRAEMTTLRIVSTMPWGGFFAREQANQIEFRSYHMLL